MKMNSRFHSNYTTLKAIDVSVTWPTVYGISIVISQGWIQPWHCINSQGSDAAWTMTLYAVVRLWTGEFSHFHLCSLTLQPADLCITTFTHSLHISPFLSLSVFSRPMHGSSQGAVHKIRHAIFGKFYPSSPCHTSREYVTYFWLPHF